jgi:hypothetical protein
MCMHSDLNMPGGVYEILPRDRRESDLHAEW